MVERWPQNRILSCTLYLFLQLHSWPFINGIPESAVKRGGIWAHHDKEVISNEEWPGTHGTCGYSLPQEARHSSAHDGIPASRTIKRDSRKRGGVEQLVQQKSQNDPIPYVPPHPLIRHSNCIKTMRGGGEVGE